jgi:hypothetical protein
LIVYFFNTADIFAKFFLNEADVKNVAYMLYIIEDIPFNYNLNFVQIFQGSCIEIA